MIEPISSRALVAGEMVPVEQSGWHRGTDAHPQEVPRHRGPERGEHALRVELDALDRQLAVADAHHLAVRRLRRDRRARSGTEVAASEW